MEYVVIGIDSQTNVSWGDGQRFTHEAAEREAARRNVAADRNGTDWCYMTLPANQWEG